MHSLRPQAAVWSARLWCLLSGDTLDQSLRLLALRTSRARRHGVDCRRRAALAGALFFKAMVPRICSPRGRPGYVPMSQCQNPATSTRRLSLLQRQDGLPRLGQFVQRRELSDQCTHQVDRDHVGPVGGRIVRILMDFDEKARHANRP